MEKIPVIINDQDILAQKGATILEVALANNIYIPHLCYHPDLKPAGNCRLCLVEIENGQLVPSCRTFVSEGMVVQTKSQKVDNVRRPIVEMLIANHHMDCRRCPKTGRCELQRIKAFMRIDKESIQLLRLPEDELPLDISNPFFIRDPNKCVLCGVCVRTCQEIQKVSAVEFVGRGYTAKIATFGDKPIAESRCVSCGECVVRCPVGALVIKGYRRPATEVKTICPHCAVGCGIFLGTRDNVIVSVRGDDDNPVNEGRLCVKGRFGQGFVNSPERLKSPLIKRKGTFVEVSWDEALEYVAGKLRNYAGEEFALFASPYCSNEDNYIAQKFARVVMGSNHVDNSARLCQGPTIAAMIEATRPPFNSPSTSHDLSKVEYRGVGAGQGRFFHEIKRASCILATGTNIINSHPVAGLRVKQAVEKGAKLIVINPKEIDLCHFAEIWLRPYPGTDVALLMGMCKVIVEEELFDNAFIKEWCDKFEEFKDSLDDFPLGRVERITGVPRDMVEKAAKIYATSKPAEIIWSVGITQYSSKTDNVLGLLNLAILTGNMRKRPSGFHVLWGQGNALGTCDMGCLPDFYPGYQEVTDPEVRKRFETVWRVSLNDKPGLTLTEILSAVHEGKIKVLYIIGSDPAMSIMPSQRVREALKAAGFIILQDIFLNETAKFAHVVLPAVSFAEKDCTYTNTEGEIQRVNKAIESLVDARPDWQIICDLARKLGSHGFDFKNSEEIMSEIASVTPQFKNTSSHIQKDRFKFIPLQYRQPAEVSNVEYPLLLIIEKDVYSGGFLTRKVEGLNILNAKELVHINPKDAADYGITDSEKVKIISRWGEMEGTAKVTDVSPPGIVSVNYTEENINLLLNPSPDPNIKTMETKMFAIRIIPQREFQDE